MRVCVRAAKEALGRVGHVVRVCMSVRLLHQAAEEALCWVGHVVDVEGLAGALDVGAEVLGRLAHPRLLLQ